MISEAKKRRFLSVNWSLSNHGGATGSPLITAFSTLSRLNLSLADTGIMVAFGSCSCQ